jgi:hypothetical protein
VWRTEGFSRWVSDNGAWADFQAGRAFDDDEYERFLEWVASQAIVPDWCILPDVVAGGVASLALSARYLNRCLSIAPMVLIAVQDGMETADLAPLVGPNIGIFLGGTTEWKLATMAKWGRFCVEHKIHYHVARVNSAKRMYQAIAAGAHSVDGSSATRYAVTLPNLSNASRQLDAWSSSSPEWPRMPRSG